MNPWKVQKQIDKMQICRTCFNDKCHTKLESKDMIYLYYPGECRYCRKVKNLVHDFTWSGKLKLLFKGN